jgi:hypothetical protein
MNRGRAGLGRPKGAQNKMTRDLKEMILHALEEAGGVAYLVKQAKKNPVAFMTLVGKVVPLQVQGDTDQPIEHRVVFGGRYKPPN